MFARHQRTAQGLCHEFDKAGPGILQHLVDSHHTVLKALDKERARQIGVRAVPRLTEPIGFGVDVGVIPSAAPARRIADRKQPVQLILMHRSARLLYVVGTRRH